MFSSSGEDSERAIEIFREWFQWKIAQAKDVAFDIEFSEFFYTDERGVRQRNTKSYEAHYFELYDVLVKHVPEKILMDGIWFHVWW
jgi:hypothetical protein